MHIITGSPRTASIFFPFFFQPSWSSIHGWTLAFLLTVHRLCGVIGGRLSHFLPRWLRTGWQSVICQGNIPWNTPPWLGIESGPQGGQTVNYPTELSWPQGGLAVIYPTELSWPQGGQTVSYPTELSWLTASITRPICCGFGHSSWRHEQRTG